MNYNVLLYILGIAYSTSKEKIAFNDVGIHSILDSPFIVTTHYLI